MSHLNLRLTPHGHLITEETEDAPKIDEAVAVRLHEAFAQGSGAGLLQLGAREIDQILSPSFAWWRTFATRYVTTLCLYPSVDQGGKALLTIVPPPNEEELATLVLRAPLMTGAEYLTSEILRLLWEEIGKAISTAFTEASIDLQSFLKELNPVWNLVGRVYFNLAENRHDPDAPFAFMATYTTHLSVQAKVQHLPLGQALREYAGATNRDKLLSLLVPVQRAAEKHSWLRTMIDGGEIFHPLRWQPANAARFLESAADFERAGIIVRMPATWHASRPARPRVTATVGKKMPSQLGLDGILDFSVEVTLNGQPLSQQERAILLSSTDSLVLLRGQWVEVDRNRLERTMQQFRDAEKLSKREGLTFAMAMRLLSGATLGDEGVDSVDAEWSQISAGPWLEEAFKKLRSPDGTQIDPGPALQGTLRPYQKVGLQWLHLLSSLGLGACLADDMGLGKTIQVLSLLLVQSQRNEKTQPSLLVAPTSLLANWVDEIKKFAPGLKTQLVHPSAMTGERIKQFMPEQTTGLDLIITSYGTLLRVPVFARIPWHLVILDEAQAIKNPNAKQTKAIKALNTRARIALTGTPVENHLSDLWSLFDFINPGLLGNSKQFTKYTKGLSEKDSNSYGPLRELVRPYILRRMKIDKAIIADLPDKTEVKAHCHLSRRQVALYEQAVKDFSILLKNSEDSPKIQRSGRILALLMRLKQICNHPSQWLNDNSWAEADSGKLARLREIAEVVAARQEKMLVFTQFREITAPLATFLGGIFGRSGLVLHGQTEVKNRKKLVQKFQEDESVPFFILSLKAGGTGLTLTAAAHVVHFDRWWNPAVENQATDRAFRIGQKKNVLVHKFICRGTVEEKIDAMIEAKQSLSDTLLNNTKEMNLTEMTNDQLLKLVRLDLITAVKDL